MAAQAWAGCRDCGGACVPPSRGSALDTEAPDGGTDALGAPGPRRGRTQSTELGDQLCLGHRVAAGEVTRAREHQQLLTGLRPVRSCWCSRARVTSPAATRCPRQSWSPSSVDWVLPRRGPGAPSASVPPSGASVSNALPRDGGTHAPPQSRQPAQACAAISAAPYAVAGTAQGASHARRACSSRRRPSPEADPPTKVSLLEVFVWFPASEMMLLSQQALQVGTRVSPKWGSYR